MGIDKIFIDVGDGVARELGRLEAIDLEVESECEEMGRLIDAKPIEFTCTIENPEEFERIILYGGDRGRYNGHILKRDGYLSPKNGWMNEDKD